MCARWFVLALTPLQGVLGWRAGHRARRVTLEEFLPPLTLLIHHGRLLPLLSTCAWGAFWKR